MNDLTVLDWGLTPYAEATARQKRLVEDHMNGVIGDTLVFTEHPPVYTMGLRNGAKSHLLWTDEELTQHGIDIAETNRGGDITYHGPGQLVGYPIVDLSAVKDLHAYLRFIEELLIKSVAAFGLTATRREGLTGIWIGTRKIAAIGVAVRRWVAYHGFALNVSPALQHFEGIVPCGIQSSDGTVTSLAAELPECPPMATVRERIALEFKSLWPEFIRGRFVNSSSEN